MPFHVKPLEARSVDLAVVLHLYLKCSNVDAPTFHPFVDTPTFDRAPVPDPSLLWRPACRGRVDFLFRNKALSPPSQRARKCRHADISSICRHADICFVSVSNPSAPTLAPCIRMVFHLIASVVQQHSNATAARKMTHRCDFSFDLGNHFNQSPRPVIPTGAIRRRFFTFVRERVGLRSGGISLRSLA